MKTDMEIPQIITDFINGVNAHDGKAMVNTFAEDGMIKNHLGSFFGKDAMVKYIDDDLVIPKVTFKACEVIEHYGDFMVTALTDGLYPKDQAPDPTYLDYFFTVREEKIVRMFIYLNVVKSVNYKF